MTWRGVREVKVSMEAVEPGRFRCEVSDRLGGRFAATEAADPVTALDMAVSYLRCELCEPDTPLSDLLARLTEGETGA